MPIRISAVIEMLQQTKDKGKTHQTKLNRIDRPSSVGYIKERIMAVAFIPLNLKLGTDRH
jgi:hypothetical protein